MYISWKECEQAPQAEFCFPMYPKMLDRSSVKYLLAIYKYAVLTQKFQYIVVVGWTISFHMGHIDQITPPYFIGKIFGQ